MAVLLILAFVCMVFANSVQIDGGNITITTGTISTEDGDLTYKLYTPSTATADNPAPGVLLLHGYQNDSETCAAYSIELARRGAVVLAIDEFGHGKTVPGLAERGWVNHKVSVNFGEDSEADGTYKAIGGTIRYKLLMNFSNLTFFDDHYSKDSEGNAIINSAEGGIAAYEWLSNLPNVDAARLGVSGHSMGTWASWSVAAAFAGAENADGEDITPKATVLQCGELFRDSVYDSDSIFFNNVLLLQAKYDEFSYFRDYQNTVTDALLRSDLRTEFLGTTADQAAWNTTYGDFSDGTARRIELLNTNHRLTTHNANGLSAAIDWFTASLGLDTSLDPVDQTAMNKEWLNLAALILVMGAMLGLMSGLLEVPFFAKIVQPLPEKAGIIKGGKWWGSALAAILITGILYPFTTQLGHALVPYPDNILRMTVGDGLATWYLFMIVINLIIMVIQLKKAKKTGIQDSLYDRGLSSREKPDHIDWKLVGKALLLAVCMAALVYLFVLLCQGMFALDLRIIWPMLGTFNAMRFGQFLLYFLVFVLYFILANSKAFANLRTEASYKTGFAGFWGTWWRSALVMTGGILLIVLIEYIPFFAGLGPGADLLFGSTFGGPFMSLMILLLPQIVAYSLIDAYCYRKTGNVYVGGIIAGILACWIVTGGSAFL